MDIVRIDIIENIKSRHNELEQRVRKYPRLSREGLMLNLMLYSYYQLLVNAP